MKLFQFFANLGVRKDYPLEEQHRVRHSNVLTMVTWLIYFGYIFYGLFIQSLFTSGFAALLLGVICVVFWLNAVHLHEYSKLLGSLVSNFSVWFAHHVFPIDHAILTTFFPIAASYIYLYHPRKERLAFYLSFGIAALALSASLLIPRHQILYIPLQPEVIAMSNASHVYISLSLMMILLIAVIFTKGAINRSLKLETQKANDALDKLVSTQEKLVESEKMALLGFLSAGLNHEINNPLTFMFGALQNLERYELKEKERQDSLSNLREGMTRISEIVKSLRNFSYQSDYMDHDCDIHKILDTCSTMIRVEKSKRMILSKDYAGESNVIKGNTGRLHQLFLNVLINAMQAIGEEGMIRIRTAIGKDTTCIEIEDNGVGISKENVSKVFNPFYTTKSPGEGTGLGLAICQMIVKEHHGEISVARQPKQGTMVRIELPLSA